jgi:hypothetical protein
MEFGPTASARLICATGRVAKATTFWSCRVLKSFQTSPEAKLKSPSFAEYKFLANLDQRIDKIRVGRQPGITRTEGQSISRNDGLLQHGPDRSHFRLLEEKGLLKRQEVKDRIEKIKAETKLSFQMVQ